MSATPRLRAAGIATAIAATISIAYADAPSLPFLPYDDDIYVTANPHVRDGVTGEGIAWALTRSLVGNWHPVTWISHMVDCELFGLAPAGHHAVNVGFHAANALLLAWFLASSTGAPGRAAMVALLWALHPLRVESVAWVAERKDVLSLFFAWISVLAYVRNVRTPSRAASALSLASFALALMAKATVVILPFALVLLDVWPLRRVVPGAWTALWARVRDKWPYFALSGAVVAITLITQSGGIHADIPLDLRLANAVRAYGALLALTFWPSGLAALYPYPIAIELLSVAISLAVLLAVTLFALHQLGSRPYLAAGWLWFLGTSVPTAGFVQVGFQGWADRYTYLPSIGLTWMVVWAVADAWRARWRSRRSLAFALAAGVSIALVATEVVLTRNQLPYWTSRYALFSRALDVTEENFYAHAEVGVAWMEKDRPDRALPHFRESLRIHPTYAWAHANLGVALYRMGDFRGAIAALERARELDPSLGGVDAELRRARAAERRGAAAPLRPRARRARRRDRPDERVFEAR